MDENKICKKCKKDHTKKSEGKLTPCEMDTYLKMGAPGVDAKGKKYYAFGTGNRFQFEGAK